MDPEFEKRLFATPLKQSNTGNVLRSPFSSASCPETSPFSPGSVGSNSASRSALSERFTPSRSPCKTRWKIDFNLPIDVLKSQRLDAASSSNSSKLADENRIGCAGVYNSLLSNELLRTDVEYLKDVENELPSSGVGSRDCRRNRYRSLLRHRLSSAGPHHHSSPFSSAYSSPYSLSPLGTKSQRLLSSPRKPLRKIARVPYKVLDAPDLQDDFYLNLVDWSGQNTLAVGLGSCVYLWSAVTSQVTKLCDLGVTNDLVTSVAWGFRGDICAVGTNSGGVQIWDVVQMKRIGLLEGHTNRVGSLAWNQNMIASGSRDRSILIRDARTMDQEGAGLSRRLLSHRQEVCGLKWAPDLQNLASGSNDNRLLVWCLSTTTTRGHCPVDASAPVLTPSIGGHVLRARSVSSSSASFPAAPSILSHEVCQPVHCFDAHRAAVKAIAWSPHQHGLLVSGGGTQDKHIRFWNTLTGQALSSIDTGSQVCNLAWCPHSNEFVSTHGYNQNQIIVWRYPSMLQLAKLSGHNFRVLYLAMSPDGESIVTGAGDETLRFWHVFSKQTQSPSKESSSVLNLATKIR